MDNLVNVIMPIFQGKKVVVVGSKVSQAENDAFVEVCENEDRSMSYVLRELAIRGLAHYKQDGQLKLTADEEKIFDAIEAPKSKLRPQARTTAETGGEVNRGKSKTIRKTGT